MFLCIHTKISCPVLVSILIISATPSLLSVDNDVSVYTDVISRSLDLHFTCGEWGEGVIRDYGLAFIGGVYAGCIRVYATFK